MQIFKPFEYVEPHTVEEACQVLLKYGSKAKLLAGGINLVIDIQRRRIQPEYVISIRRIPGLDYIEYGAPNLLSIGALTSLRSIEVEPNIQTDYMALYEAVHSIASIQVKTMGTAVGNLCVGTPASDVAVALIALGSKLRIASTASERVIPIEDFYLGVKQTAAQAGEIVTEIMIPSPAAPRASSFIKVVRTATDVAKVNVAVTLTITNNTCEDATIAIGSVAPTPIRASKAEAIIRGQKPDKKVFESAAEAASEEARPITDYRSTAKYRNEMIRILTRRAIENALQRINS